MGSRSPNHGSPEGRAQAQASPYTLPLPEDGSPFEHHPLSEEGHTDHSDGGSDAMDVEGKPRTVLQTVREENRGSERLEAFAGQLRHEMSQMRQEFQSSSVDLQARILDMMRDTVMPQVNGVAQEVSALRKDVDGITLAMGNAQMWSMKVEQEKEAFASQLAETSLKAKQEFAIHKEEILKQRAEIAESFRGHEAEILRQKTSLDEHRQEIVRQGQLVHEQATKSKGLSPGGGIDRGMKIPYPTYNGTKSGTGCHTVEGFLKRFRQAMDADTEQRGVPASEATMIYLLAGCLRGAAAEWYATQEDGLSLEELSRRMMTRFQPVVTLYEIQTRLRNRKKRIGETMEEYAQALTTISLDGPLESRNGNSLVMAFADGLTNGSVNHPGAVWQSQVYQMARAANEAGREVTVTQALQVFCHLPESSQKQIGTRASTSSTGEGKKRFGLVAHQGGDPVCRHCNQKGHVKMDCPEVVCYRCQGKGHMSARCPLKEDVANAGNVRSN